MAAGHDHHRQPHDESDRHVERKMWKKENAFDENTAKRSDTSLFY